ncbi:Uncharacterized protein family UPF0497 [Macleaya cordata]|uniref:CASP-like protein n=1 Tax=Macleaya cordata TaxID=56857 RepID=A0A200QHB6_MACCD|nr:Uncharacterized protein family UPF0497 [Macleaya cordata]
MEEEKRKSISNTEEKETEVPMEKESSPLRAPARFLPGELEPFSPLESPPPPENPQPPVRFLTKEKKSFFPPQPPPTENPQSPVRFYPGERKPFSSLQPPPTENPQSPVRFLPGEKKTFSPPQPPPPENPQSPVRFLTGEKKTFSSPQLPPLENPQSTAIVPMERRSIGFSSLRSPPEQKKYLTPPETPHESVPVKPSSPVIVVNRSIREELSVMSKMDNGEDGHSGGRREDVENGNDRRPKALSSILRRERKVEMVKRAALGFRVCAVVFCLISFSVMASDKTQGWAGDSFDRYKEYRYCISVNIIGFVYAGFQAYDLAYNLITEKHVIPRYFGYYFDFSMDQVMTYLLISASSSAATRVDDWVTNWGKDEFTVMATASIGMSFMAFFAFAFSSLISGYNLCTRNYNY